MSFGSLLSVISSLFFEAAKSPKGWYWGLAFNNFLVSIWQAICSLFYWLCKWLLALVDFLQYFIQKLIGLDYWLRNGKKTWSGAIQNDILFSFLYNDTVQKVFRAMIGIFVVLLIIFTIVKIIKQEWQYITGDDFGKGTNSKAKIIRDALKAIALVIVFPMMLMVGIISSNAILASLVKALNIDMSSTFGGTIFAISAQSANKYRLYASSNKRKPASNEITFYTDSAGKVILYGKGSDTNVTYVTNYQTYLNAINDNSAKKRTVESMFESVNPSSYGKKNLFSGYCIGINDVWYMVHCDYSKREDMKLYLRYILKANILTSSNNANTAISSALGGSLSYDGWISGVRLDNIPQAEDLCQACYNTWRYGTLYSELNVGESKNDTTISFERSLSYEVVNNDQLRNLGVGSVSNAKVLYNSNEISPYYDGGQFGFVQIQAEYNIMADVIDYINDTQATLYMMDATSDLINWNYTDNINQDKYQVDSKWIGANASTKGSSVTINNAKYKAFVTSYSDDCSDTETGNVLNLAIYGKSNELEGTKYIMCWKVPTSDGKTQFIPLVHGKSFTDPLTNKKYNFQSSYFDDSYRGVVFAKGLLDANSSDTTNAKIGEPTYIKSDVYGTDKNGNTVSLVSTDTPYYYELKKTGDLVQYVESPLPGNMGFDVVAESNKITYDGIESINLDTSYSGYSWTLNVETLSDGSLGNYISLVKDAEQTSFTDDMIQTMTLMLKRNSTSNKYRAEYANVKYNNSLTGRTQYLFSTTENSYFVVELDTGIIRVKGVKDNGSLEDWNSLKKIKTVTKTYKLMYSYKENETEVESGELITLNAGDFKYVSSSSDGYSMFQTIDKVSISSPKLKRTMYVNAYFDTNKTSLINFNLVGLECAEGFGNTSADADKSHLTQQSSFYTIYLYNYLTSMIKSTTLTDAKFVEYNVETNELKSVDRPDASDPNNEFITQFNMNVNDFVWEKDSDSISLYDGKNYVAQLFKQTGSTDEFGYEPGTNLESFLKSRSTSITIDGHTYYNIETQNCFTADSEAGAKSLALTYYKNSLMDLRLGFYRDNLEFRFLGPFDFNFSLVGNMRFKLVMFHRYIDTIKTNAFELYDGISFDYFFDGKIDLYTFYVPSKISYWIILIASALIIKVLGTALWGVIKRFYTITLYFIAMPAVASTIPLDSGSRFNDQITKPLISNVLGTYGVILGINVFFILLAPVKSISNIFTDIDIEQSGYFLKKLSGIISVKLINNYVYVLFVLVAFTLINDLPKVISQIVGGNDIVAEGKSTKENSFKALDEAGKVMSGKAAKDDLKRIGGSAVDMVPGGVLAKKAVSRVTGTIRQGFNKAKDDDSSQSNGSSRSDEEFERLDDSGQGGSGAGGSGQGGTGEAHENDAGSGAGGSGAGGQGSSRAEEAGEGLADADPMNGDSMENALVSTAENLGEQIIEKVQEGNPLSGGAGDGEGADGAVGAEGAGGADGVVGENAEMAVDVPNNPEGGEQKFGPDGKPIENGEQELGPDGKPIKKDEQKLGPDGQPVSAVAGIADKDGKSKKSLLDEIREKSDKQVGFVKALPGTVGNAVKKFGKFLTMPLVLAGKGVAKGAQFVGHGIAKGTEFVGHGIAKGAKVVGHGIAKGVSVVGNTTKKVVKASGKALATVGKLVAAPLVIAGKGVAKGAKVVGHGIAKGVSIVGNTTKKVVKASARTLAAFGKKMAAPLVIAGKGVAKGAKAVGHGITKGASWVKNTTKKVVKAIPAKAKAFVDKHQNFKKFIVASAATGYTMFRSAKWVGSKFVKGASWVGRKTVKATKNVGHVLAQTAVGRAIMSGAMTVKNTTSNFAQRVGMAVAGLPIVSTINRRLHRRNAIRRPSDENSRGVNDHNAIHFSSSLAGKGATGRGRTAGQIIARSVQDGVALSEEQVNRIAVSEFNEQALSDTNFIDNKASARANVVRNQVGTKIGKRVVTEVLSNYAVTEINSKVANSSTSNKIATAILGGNGKKGLLTQSMRTQLIKSTMSKEEAIKFDSSSEADKQRTLAKYKTTALISADGSIGFAVDNGANKVKVDSKTSDNVVSQMISSNNISDNDIVNAVAKTGATSNIDMALAQNVANGINFTSENSSTTTSLMANAVFDKASQNEDIVAEAMLRHIESSKQSNPALYQRFQDEFNVGNLDLSDSVNRGRVIEQIKMFNRSDNANIINTMNKDSYANEFTGLVQEKVQNGSLKVTAWQLADDETRQKFSEKTKTNLAHITESSVLDGATNKQKEDIIANTTTNIMRQTGDTREARQIQDTAFIKNVSNQELRNIKPETLNKLVGRSVEVEDLTAEDKAFLGFVKARNGGTFQGVNSDAVSVAKYRRDSANGVARFNSFNTLSNEIKSKAAIENNKLDVYAQIATQDATYGMTKQTLNKAQVGFIAKMGDNIQGSSELNRMYAEFTGKEGATVATASQASLIRFLSSNDKASNFVTQSMRESGYDFNKDINANYQPQFTRTTEESEIEYNRSVQAIEKNAPTSIYNAFVASQMENKDVITNQMFAKYANIESSSTDSYKDALAGLKANNVNVNSLIMKGYSESNIVMAYKKAQLVGDIGANGRGASEDLINEYLNLTTDQNNQILRKMQNLDSAKQQSLFAGGASYLAVANTLSNDLITDQERSGLVSVAALAGYNAMSTAEQNYIINDLALKDSQIRLNASGDGSPASDKRVSAYINSREGREDRSRLEEKARTMSYYELNAIVNENSTSESAYRSLRDEVTKSNQVNDLYKSQGSLIDVNSLQREIVASGNESATEYVASNYSEKINTISKAEEQQIRVNAEYEALDRDTVTDIRNSKASAITSAQTRALYTEFITNDKYSKKISDIRKSDEYKTESKKDGFNAENYISNKMVKSLEADSIYGAENKVMIAKIRQNAEKQAIVAEAISRDSSLGIELDTIGTEAVELKNKQRLALGGATRINMFADAIKDNSNLYKKARIAFRSQKGFGGKELEEVDETTRNNFLVNNFANSLVGEDKELALKINNDVNMKYMSSLVNSSDLSKIKSVSGANFTGPTTIKDFVEEASRRNLSIDEAIESYGISKSMSLDNSKAAELYNRIHKKDGKTFASLSTEEKLQKTAEYEYAKKTFESKNKGVLFENTGDVVQYKQLKGFSANLSKKALNDYLNSTIVNNMSSYDFNDIYQSSKHENYGEETEVFKNVKKGIINSRIDDTSEVYNIQRSLSRSSASVIELAKTDKRVVASVGENATTEAISKFLGKRENRFIANELKQKAAENIFIEKMLGATFEGQDIANLNEEQKQTALMLSRSAKITNSVDVSAMNGKEKRDYEYRRNLIQQEIRNDANPQILANTFKNTTLINESQMVNEMIGGYNQEDILHKRSDLLKNNNEFMSKIYGLVLNSNGKDATTIKSAIISDYESKTKLKFSNLSVENKNNLLAKYMQDAEFIKNNNLTKTAEKVNNSINSEVTKYAMKASTTELKQGLNEDQINTYLRAHDNVKDQLVSLAASNVTLALDKETQNARKIDSVMSNRALQNQTAVQMMKDQFNYDNIVSKIFNMLTDKSNKNYNAQFDKTVSSNIDQSQKLRYANTYITQNYKDLLTKVSMETFFDYDRNGRSKLKEKVEGKDVNETMTNAINKLSDNSKLYKDTLESNISKIVDPSSRATDSEKANFFASTNAKAVSKQMQELNYNFGSVRSTISNIYKVNARGESEFVGFYNKATNAIPSGVYKTGGQVIRIDGGEFKSAIYKQKTKLPETSKKYDEWNNQLQKLIEKAKKGEGEFSNLTRSERQAQVKDLESRKIDVALPDNFYSMTNAQQIQYRNSQNMLKNEALATNFNKIFKASVKYEKASPYVGMSFAGKIGRILSERTASNEAVQEKHKVQLSEVEALISRFDSTKAMRNNRVDFGTNFNNFANSYVTNNEFNTIEKKTNKQFISQMKGQIDKNGKTINDKNLPKFADLTDAQQRLMMQIREQNFKGMLRQKQKIAEKKVQKDNGIKMPSLHSEYGTTITTVKYKDGTSKYTHQQSRLSKVADEYRRQMRENGTVSPSVKKNYERMYGKGGIESVTRNQNNLINLKNQYNKLQEFNNTFKGTKSEYKQKVQELLGGSTAIDDIYRRYGALFGNRGEFSLANSPVAVQKNEIMNGLMRQISNVEKRLSGQYKGYIPASGLTNTGYVGKTLTNSRNSIEMANTRRVANELNNELKKFNVNSKTLSYDQMYSMLKPYMRDSFKAGRNKEFATYSDERKKELLRKHLESSLIKANNRVNNDSFFGTDVSKLQKLNGTYIERRTSTTGTADRIVGSEVYQQLVKNYNNAKSKIDLEQLNIDRIAKALREKTNGPQTLQTKREIANLRQSLEASRIKMKTYKAIYEDTGNKKRNFEQAYASKRIEEATVKNNTIKFNPNDVKNLFDDYSFPLKVRLREVGPDGRPLGVRQVRPGTQEAKMIERSIGNFIMKYKNQIQTMAKSMVEPELEDMNKYIKSIANNLSSDFGKVVRDLRRTERKLSEKLKRVDTKNKSQSKEIKNKLENNLEQLRMNEKNLMDQLRAIGVDTNQITAISHDSK